MKSQGRMTWGFVLVGLSLALGPAVAGADDKAATTEALTLDRIFPEKSFFGTSASGVSFSHDGRFAAFLYRPYEERRHGNDLYVYDTHTGFVRRMTSASRMATYSAEARKVVEDREKKAKQAKISLARLAHDQEVRLGWIDRTPLGTWQGDATTQSGPIAAGAVRLSLTMDDVGTMTGSVGIGLVVLSIRDVVFDAEQRILRGIVDGPEKKDAGEISLTLNEDQAIGWVTMREPEQTLALQLNRSPEAASAQREKPRGVIGADGERLALGDVVLETDAEINDEKNGQRPKEMAPRYAGISSFEWSPTSTEMLVMFEGDVYRLSIDPEGWGRETVDEASPEAAAAPSEDAGEGGEAPAEPEGEGGEAKNGGVEQKAEPERKPIEPYRGVLTRLTLTRERESDVQYLPDGSGYTYLRAGALLRVSFGDHTIMQLDPSLKDGERMVGYRISPDQKRLVFLANRGDNYWSGGRQVTIVNYRDRFARAETVTRHMPDDPWPEAYSSVYLYDLAGHDVEKGSLERVFTRRLSGPRDIMRVPEWSPDSSRIAFAAFDQSSGHMKILEAGFVDKGSPKVDAQPVEPVADATPAQTAEKGSDQAVAEPDFEIKAARVVYQFLHHGGPNTPGMVAPMYLPDSRRMVFITELSGYRHLHLLDPRYEALTQVTQGPYEVYPFHLSEDHTTLFVTATRDDPNQEQVYAINLESLAMTRLTTEAGVFSGAAARDDGSLVLARHVDFGRPAELVAVIPGDPASMTVMTDSHPEEAHKLTTASPTYFAYENRHGQTIHGHMFKPADWTEGDKRPLLIYVYGGPLGERKMATRGDYAAPSYFFARYMAEVHGWVTATIDPRGASGYGAVFEKANFEQVGKPQTEDLVDGARWLVKHHGVDEKKMAMHGWSFGGFQTQMVMYTEPDVFAVGIAGAGPTEWHNYNSWYSTGTIGSNRPGKTDLEQFSLLPLAKNLKGKLLLVHGVEDSNVLYQDTVRVYRELLKAGKEVNVELFLDPTGGHGLGGDVKTIGRYRKYEDFLIRHLGKGSAVATAGEESGSSADIESSPSE